MRIFLITLLVMFGTQATAKTVNGSKAVDLVLKAHKKGLILETNCKGAGCYITILLDGRFYQCWMAEQFQYCTDNTKN
jgi:hypothetical protein